MLTLKSLSTTRMVLSLGGGEGRARPSAKDNGSLVALSKDREPKIFNKVARFFTQFVTLSLFKA